VKSIARRRESLFRMAIRSADEMKVHGSGKPGRRKSDYDLLAGEKVRARGT
jgi:hypothetical protein